MAKNAQKVGKPGGAHEKSINRHRALGGGWGGGGPNPPPPQMLYPNAQLAPVQTKICLVGQSHREQNCLQKSV